MWPRSRSTNERLQDIEDVSESKRRLLHCDPHLDQTKLNNLLPLTIDGVLNVFKKVETWWFQRTPPVGVEKESGFYPERGRLWTIKTSLQLHHHPQFVQKVKPLSLFI